MNTKAYSLRIFCAFFAFSVTLAFSLPPLPSRLPAVSAISRKPNQKLVARAKAKGYQRGAHKEKNEIRNRHKYMKKIKKDHNATLNRYVL
jgi:hypothetical protein